MTTRTVHVPGPLAVGLLSALQAALAELRRLGALVAIIEDMQVRSNLLGEAIGLAASDLGNDDPGILLAELIEAVQDRVGRQLIATPDRGGVAATIEAIDRYGERLLELTESSVEDGLADLAAYNIEIGHGEDGGRWVRDERIDAHPCTYRPVMGESIALDDGRLLRVARPPHHVMRGLLVRCTVIDSPASEPW